MEQGFSHQDGFIRAVIEHQDRIRREGRLYGTYIARVTNNKDPLALGRIKVRPHWLEDSDKPEMESDWFWRMTPTGSGPTKMDRNRVFGMDWPLPEVGSLVVISFNEGDPHDGIYHGAINYGESGLGVPALKKDKDIDWSWRMAMQNGFEAGVDTDGNFYLNVPGNMRVKVLCSAFFSTRGVFTIVGTRIRALALSVLRLLAPQIDETNYPRPDEAAELREMTIDAMNGTPGYKDPGIGKISDLGDESAP